MHFIKNSTLEYPVSDGDIKLLYKASSFPSNIEAFINSASELGYSYVHDATPPVHNPDTHYVQRAASPEQVVVNGSTIWRQKFNIVAFTEQELTDRSNAKATTVRRDRDLLLKDSDWTQMFDSPLSDLAKSAWHQYRQELRDISDQPGFPTTVNWPTEPVAPYSNVIPKFITRYQGRAQLSVTEMIVGGVTTDALTVLENAMTSESAAVKLAWNEASIWERSSPLVLQIATGFNWTSEMLDQFFIDGVQITA